VAESLRGHGYGLYLIDASLVHLCAQGVRGCVIDWTVFLDLYGRFGFKLYNQYHMLRKELP
jgi:predicted N-acetyltransferase YhbS